MILQVFDGKFFINMEQTMELSSKEAVEHCTCAYCRNFYASVDDRYPNLRPFLAQFGVHIEAPDEMMPFDQPGEIWYDNVYSVSGRILSGIEHSFTVDGLEVCVCAENNHDINPLFSEPHFFIEVGMMQLPWILDESMQEVISPANEPSFLGKMWTRLLGRIKNDQNQS